MSTALLSSTFWLLLNTPMVPPERKTRSKSVPMVNLGATTSSSHSRRSSTSSVASDATTTTTSAEENAGGHQRESS